MSEQQMVLPSGERGEKFLFSVIMPVYNTEKYVEETIQSVITQTIGFIQNIQLILVNNATTDNAGAICERYQRDYPYNVVYIELLENRGPSGARNAGIPYVCGKYVNFLDSDDKWDKNAYKHVAQFIEKYGEEVTFISCRKHYFEAWDSWFYDDSHFKKTRVCSIWNEPGWAQFWLGSGFFRVDVLDRIRFDEKAAFSEDMKLLNEELIYSQKYGIVSEAVFYYRKRTGDNLSQVQCQKTEKYWYFESLDRSYVYLMNYSKQQYGKIIPYIQYVIMQEIAWRICQDVFPDNLSDEEIAVYKDRLRWLINQIDDYIIYSTPNLWKEYRLACLKLKYGEDIFHSFECRNGRLFFHNLMWCSLEDSTILTIVEHHVEGDALILDGKINMPFPVEYYEIFTEDNFGNRYLTVDYPGDEGNIRLSLGEPCLIKRCFRVEVPLSGVSNICFKIRWGEVVRNLPLGFGKFSKLTQKLKNNCCFDGDYLFRVSGRFIMVESAVNALYMKWENAIRDELREKKYKRALMLRILSPIVRKRLQGKKLWLISDRSTRARDNGEFLFRYLSHHPQKDIEVYFAISKESKDYRRIKQYGKVVEIGSFWYQLIFLTADAVLSSTWGYAIEDPFGWHRDYVKDLFHYRYIYLDHALTKDDISLDVNKHARNFAMWTTGSQAETKSILRYPYGYSPDVPQTTGLARYDAIYPAIHTPHKKVILIAPTWRKSLAKNFNKNGLVEYNSLFVESEFFRFYNTLINDKSLLTRMENYGYRGVFRLHPTISTQVKDFQQNNLFVMQTETELYETEFFETAMVVTDYSSIAMDYGYIGRPVVYAQFDKEDFYRTHSYHESYFDYENDGFGPVCYDYESTVDAMIQMIEKGCIMDDIYAVRRKQFFAYIDDKNCERICRAVRGICDARNEYTGGQGNG